MRYTIECDVQNGWQLAMSFGASVVDSVVVLRSAEWLRGADKKIVRAKTQSCNSPEENKFPFLFYFFSFSLSLDSENGDKVK